MERDVICGMQVDPGRAAAREAASYKGGSISSTSARHFSLQGFGFEPSDFARAGCWRSIKAFLHDVEAVEERDVSHRLPGRPEPDVPVIACLCALRRRARSVTAVQAARVDTAAAGSRARPDRVAGAEVVVNGISATRPENKGPSESTSPPERFRSSHRQAGVCSCFDFCRRCAMASSSRSSSSCRPRRPSTRR